MNAVAPDKNEKSIRSGGSAAAISDNNQNMLLNNRQSIQDFTWKLFGDDGIQGPIQSRRW